MPQGETSIPLEQLPDDHQWIHFPLVATVGVPNAGTHIGQFYADRDMVLDRIIVGVGAATSGATTTCIRVFYRATPILTANDGNANFVLGGAGIADEVVVYDRTAESNATGPFTKVIEEVNVQGQNFIPAGNWVNVVLYSTTQASQNANVSVKFRTKIA